MRHDPRYPIGPWRPPLDFDSVALAAAIDALSTLPRELAAAVEGLADDRLDLPYREGGWTVRQLVHHVADSHLNAYCRHRLALTEERPTIRPYDQDAWATLADSLTQPVAVSLALLEALHARWTAFLRPLRRVDFDRQFLHPDRPGAPWRLGESVLMYAWHGRHHTAQIVAARERGALHGG